MTESFPTMVVGWAIRNTPLKKDTPPGDLSYDDVLHAVENGYMKNLPVYVDHDEEKKVGRVIDTEINSPTRSLRVFIAVDKTPEGCNAYNRIRAIKPGQTPGPTDLSGLSLRHQLGSNIPTEISLCK